jgi:hypothetical protein
MDLFSFPRLLDPLRSTIDRNYAGAENNGNTNNDKKDNDKPIKPKLKTKMSNMNPRRMEDVKKIEEFCKAFDMDPQIVEVSCVILRLI